MHFVHSREQVVDAQPSLTRSPSATPSSASASSAISSSMPRSGRVSIFPCHCAETPDEVRSSRIEALHDDEVDVKFGHGICQRANARQSLFVAAHPLDGDVDIRDFGEAYGRGIPTGKCAGAGAARQLRR